MILAASIDWTHVLVELILTVPAIIAAVYTGRIHRKIKTPSGTPIGQQVEGTLHTALANNYHLQTIANANGGTAAAARKQDAP